MHLLLFAAAACALLPSALSAKCYVGNTSSCLLQPVDDFSACYSCDGGPAAEAGSCWIQAPAPHTAMCADVRPQCEADGGVFSWCYGDACNSCTPRSQRLALDAWTGKSVAFVTAHPDDLEALAGASVAALTKQVGPSARAGCAPG